MLSHYYIRTGGLAMNCREQQINLDDILTRAVNGAGLERDDVLYLLDLETAGEIEKLFSAARQVRTANFADQVYLYGFIYFSTYCRNDCTFCYYRRSNQNSERYRKTGAEIIETAHKLAQSGLHLLDLTMGEDPYYQKNGNFDQLLEITAQVKADTGLPVMISPGVVPQDILGEFKKIGVDWYACYQETHNRRLYEELRLDQSYDERLSLKNLAHQHGLLTEEGLLAGIGETNEDLYNSFQVMDEISADQVRVMSFVPQKGTPLEKHKVLPHRRELIIIAVMRLLFPDRLIPASLDVEGLSGLELRLNAGANVITSLIPPDEGLQGVSQSTLDIDEGGRTVDGITPVLEACNLCPASLQNYRSWLEKAKTRY